MNDKLRHFILRSYVALARGEHYTPSEIGETVDFFQPNTGESIGSLPAVQLNWTENDKLIKEFCLTRNITAEKVSDLMIFAKPTAIQNFVYSSVLRKAYDVGNLRFMREFDRDGNFILPLPRGFFVPKREGKFITNLAFYETSSLRIKKAA